MKIRWRRKDLRQNTRQKTRDKIPAKKPATKYPPKKPATKYSPKKPRVVLTREPHKSPRAAKKPRDRRQFMNSTISNLHLVACLPTSRQQVVFALLVPSCQQVWTTLLTVVTSVEGSFRPHQEAGAVAKNATTGSLTGIEPASLRFRCSALTK